MTTETFTRFHASPHGFDFPDREKMDANQTGHDNGRLGLWVSVKSDWIEGFGSNIYEVEVMGLSLDLPLSTLSGWASKHHNDPDFYRRTRDELIAQGVSYLRLLENDGRSEMGVVVDFAAIQNFRKLQDQTKAPRP